MTHELKTPLTAMIGLLEDMWDEEFGELNEKQHQVIENCIREDQALLNLINDILSWS